MKVTRCAKDAQNVKILIVLAPLKIDQNAKKFDSSTVALRSSS
jgi:hypothetical protein